MDDAEPEVKVTDRRHFTAEGEVRTESPAAEEAEGTPLTHENESGGAAPEAAPGIEEGSHNLPVTFSGFIISLASQAASLLGAEKKELNGARQIISVLEMLKEKTEGRRTDEESKIIDLVLFDLRMAFVGSAKEPGR